jgi:hypothetical protein
MNATALQPFLTVALPLMFTILVAVWVNTHGVNRGFDGMSAAMNGIHKRLDDLGSPLDRMDTRLERIEAKLDNHETRIIRVEERTSPLTGGPIGAGGSWYIASLIQIGRAETFSDCGKASGTPVFRPESKTQCFDFAGLTRNPSTSQL